ncbi:hypothetical protein J1605_004983 [Eschrichtius robustus]|uniref:J domain-containing protein n=1 Tax=Eschrichtius robustus TaxID=9764 RepID=A0AB34HE67_ESCRO|nr:hypothetical protein J1605_004983 [Eschrichtius robustus]
MAQKHPGEGGLCGAHHGGASGHYCQPEEEVARLLTMAGVPEDELNPFHVVGVEVTASDVELKKAYRQPAVMVHPDKNNHPRAEEAFKVLRAAWDIVSSPERPKEYEMKQMAENELSRSDFLSRIFQVPPGQMSNGNFFAAPQPGPGATAASKPNSTVPKGEAKPKWREKVRRPFQR